MNYFLMNILERANKFFADNQFDETIIKGNKNKIKLLANPSLDKILREIITLNIILFAKTKETMAKKVVFLIITIIT